MGEREMKKEGEFFKENNERGVGREKKSWVVVTEVLLLLWINRHVGSTILS